MAAQVVRTAIRPLQQWQFRLFLSPQLKTTVSIVPHHRLYFLTFPSLRRRYAHFRPQGLRLPRELSPEKVSRKITDSDEQIIETPEEEEKKRKSRNEMKREARKAVRWGMDLASFSIPQIKRILKAASLEREVLEALMAVKRFGPDVREGKRRQFNYIGKLLRDAQPDLLEALIQATKDGDQSRFQALAGSMKLVDESAEEEFQDSESESEQEHEDSGDHLILASRWYDGLIDKDIQISNEVYSVDSVEFDRQELRRLVRKVHNVQDHLNSNEEHEEKSGELELAAAKKSLNRFLSSLAKRLSSAQNVIL